VATITWEDPVTGMLHGVEFDATVSENHTSSATVSRRPIAFAESVADHVQPEPDVVTLEGVITNAPSKAYTAGDMYGPVISAYLPMSLLGRDGSPLTKKRLVAGAYVSGYNRFSLPKLLPVPFGIDSPPFVPASKLYSDGTTVPSVYVTTPDPSSIQALRALSPVDRCVFVLDMLRDVQRNGVELTLNTRLGRYEHMALSKIEAPVDNVDWVKFSLQIERVKRGSVSYTTVTPKVPVAEKRAEKKEEAGAQPTESHFPDEAGRLRSLGHRGLGSAAETAADVFESLGG
jgi:hypothetical protein